MTEASRQRATQQRAEETRHAILDAAVELFSTQGYEGVSIKAVEQASGTKRGLVAYHYSDKETLWRAAADETFSRLRTFTDDEAAALSALDTTSQLRAHLSNFIVQSARHPEVSRLIIQEGKQRTWRLEYLVEHQIRPRLEQFSALVSKPVDAHDQYIFLGAATLVFDVEAEVEALFGFNPREDDFVTEHARRVCDLLIERWLGLPD